MYYLAQSLADWFGSYMATGWLFLNPASALYQFTAANHSPYKQNKYNEQCMCHLLLVFVYSMSIPVVTVVLVPNIVYQW